MIEQKQINRVWLITGASSGFGMALAEAALAEGDKVAATARRVEKLDDLIQQAPEKAHAVALDVTDSEGVSQAVEEVIEHFGRVDVLVNNAGVYPTEGVFSVSEETFVQALDINTVGSFRTCQAFVPAMVERGYGRVVNVSSGGGSFGEGLGPAAYAVSKAALNAITVKVSQALRGDVKANVMCPAPTGRIWVVQGLRARPKKPRTRWCGWRHCRPTGRTAGFSGTGSQFPGRKVSGSGFGR
ncbi:MAG: SDR family NAD(P)-dependent oxidoreductase [Rubrobacteraceae bacterium]